MIYFDNASTSYPKPSSVSKAVRDAIESPGAAGRGAYEASISASRTIYVARELAAGLFKAEPLNVAFTGSCTLALNAAINSFAVRGAVTAISCAEHNSVLRPLYLRKAEVRAAGIDESEGVDETALEKIINGGANLCVVSHASNVTGRIIDAEKIGFACKKRGAVFILDAAQSAGFAEIDMRRMNIDILCFSGHKALRGPQGTGGLCINPAKKLKLKPFVTGGSGSDSFSKSQPGEMPGIFEAGTHNMHSIAGLLAAFNEFSPENEYAGIGKIHKMETELTNYFIRKAGKIPGLRIYAKNGERCPVVSFNLKNFDSQSVADELYEKHGIACRAGIHCAPLIHTALGTEKQGAVRFSFSYYNSEGEIDASVAALNELASH